MSRTLTHGLWQAVIGIFTRLSLSAVPLCYCQRLLPWSGHGRCEYALVPQLPQFKANILAQAIAAENASAESSRDSQSPQFCPFASEASLVLSSYFLWIFRNNGNKITDFWTLPIKTVCLWIEKRGNGSNCCLIKCHTGTFRMKDLLIWRSDTFVSSIPPSSEIAPC